MTDTKRLRKKIDGTGISITHISEQMGITRECFYNKLNTDTEFKASEIVALSKLLHLSDKERDAIFFAI